MLVLSKADLVTPEVAEAARQEWHARLNPDAGTREAWEEAPADEVPVLVTSSAVGQGMDELRALLLRTVPYRNADDVQHLELATQPLADHRVYRPVATRDWTVERVGESEFRVDGPGILRLMARHDLENEESLEYVESRLRRMGVIEALQTEGFEPGDDVEIAGVVFEFDPEA